MTQLSPELRSVARKATDEAFRLAQRSHRGIADPDYRRAIVARLLTRWLHRLNSDVRYLGIVEDGELTFLHATDSVITPWTLTGAHFSQHLFQTAWYECQRYAPRSDRGIFVDVGAHVGTTTLYALRTGDFSGAVCLEPAPDNLEVLKLNILTNRLTDIVSVIPAACSDNQGSADLWVASGNQGDHRLANTNAVPDTHTGALQVDTVSLDYALKSLEVDPSDVSMVWVDTQGHEPRVLEGARGLIDTGAPFCIEFWPTQYSESGTLDQVMELVQERFVNFVDLGTQKGSQFAGSTKLCRRPMSAIAALAEQLLQTGEQTDILLLPGSPN